MSIILDALKRAEGERRSLRGYESFRYVLVESRPGAARRWRWAALAGVVVLGLGLGAFSGQAPWWAKERGPAEEGEAHAIATPRPAPPKKLSVPSPPAVRPPAPSTFALEEPWVGGPASPPTPVASPPTRAPEAPRVAPPSRQSAKRPPAPSPAPSASPPARAPGVPRAAVASPQSAKRAPARPETPPRTPEGWVARARALEREGKWARAQAAYERALGAGFTSAEARLGLGALAERQGRGQEALAHYLAALRIRPNDARAHARLGRLYAARGSYHLAINEYHLAMRLAPQDPQPAYSLSVLYARLRRPEHAMRYLEEAVARDARMGARARRERAFAPLRREPTFQTLTGAGRRREEP